MSKYGYRITTEKISPPLGGMYHYAAKIAYLFKKDANGSEIPVGVPNELGEQWGRTEDEVRNKLAAATDRWIAQQSE